MLGSLLLPYTVVKFEAHSRLKQALLCAIDNTTFDNIELGDYRISKTDWNLSDTVPRPYINVISNDLTGTLQSAFTSMGFDKYQIHNVWFQQYTTNAEHPWHNHAGCHFTCIYYVELPDDSLLTQFINPVDQSTVFQIDAKEGDILLIPSIIKHRSPKVTSNSRKTIISFNASAICDIRY